MDTIRVVRDPAPEQYTAEKYINDDVLQGVRMVPAIDQPNAGWKQHWHRQDVADCVIFTPRSNAPLPSTPSAEAPVRTFGHCEGWEWGYALWEL